jgi:amino acid adenylation domain-containing protein
MADSDLSEQKQALLARYLRVEQPVARRGENGPIPRRPCGHSAPLSFAQQRLWFLDRLEPGSSAYIISLLRRLPGELLAGALGRALGQLCARHEILRTTFQADVQVIHRAAGSPLRVVDLQGLPRPARDLAGQELAHQEGLVPFDLAAGPLLRVYLLRQEPRYALLLVTLHHIIADGWSNEIFFREFTYLYQACAGQLAGRAPLPALPVQYADFALWQRQWLTGAVLHRQLAYWKQQLQGLSPLELPLDRPRPPVQSWQGASRVLWLPHWLHAALMVLAQRERVTLFVLLLAAFTLLLARYSGQRDIAVGSPVAGRTRRELEDLIGCFVNTLVLRTQLVGNPPFQEVLAQVREMVLAAHAHQDLPFEHLVELLEPERDLSRSPLFQVMFSVQQLAGPRPGPEEAVGEPYGPLGDGQGRGVKFDLEMHLMSGCQGLRCAVAYRTDLFEDSSIERLLRHFCALLEGIVAQPRERWAYLPLLTADERQHLLIERNATRRAYPLRRPFIRHFSEQVLRVPESIALCSAQGALTYEALQGQALHFARTLQSLGVGAESLVALAMERSFALVVGLLAVFHAGGAYLPVDIAMPAARVRTILEDAAVSVVVTSPAARASLPALPHCQIICADPQASAPTRPAPQGREQSEHLAYVIYTSGSTGQPKGAMVVQSGMLNHLLAKIEALQIGSQDCVAQTASHCFDISVWQMLAALLSGGRVQIFTDELAREPAQLFAAFAREGVTIAEVVPSLLQALLDMQVTGETSLRWLVATGEALPAAVAGRWLQRYPAVALLNAYGPTECSDDVLHAWLTPASLAESPTAPLGQAVANTRIYVLDPALQPVPAGVSGQIYVGGAGVGRGYVGDPERTAASFVPDPFSEQAGARLYRTGDLGCYHASDNLYFLKRLDQQIKVRGYRIEPGEIEQVLLRHPGVRQAVVVAQQDGAQAHSLLAYVVGAQVDAGALRQHLQQALPAYMQPAALLFLPALPLTSNGKIDRRALPRPQGEASHLPEPGEQAGRTPVEELLLGLWREVLGRTAIGVQENFFHLGGHSLLATRLISRIQAVFGLTLPVRTLFEAPCVAALAVRVQAALGDERHRPLPALLARTRQQDLPLSFAQQRLWFVDRLQPGNTAYLIPRIQRLSGPLQIRVLEQSLAALIARHESLRTVFRVRDEQPVQVILPTLRLRLPVVDLRSLEPQQRSAQVSTLAASEARQACDLARGPLLRVHLLRLQADAHIFLLTMHHIISDGWSQQVLLRDLRALYLAGVAGQQPALAALAVQYADYALWQRQWLTGALLAEYLDYWRCQLAGAPVLQLPAGRRRLDADSPPGAGRSFRLPEQSGAALTRLCQQEGVTLFMLLLAAFQVVLACYSGQRDIVIGTDIANRNHQEIEGLIGFFVNQLVLRGRLEGNPAFRDLLRQAREVALGAYTYQDLPFERLVQELRPARQAGRTPFFQIKLVVHNAAQAEPAEESAPGSLRTQVLTPQQQTAKFDLILNLVEEPRGIAGWIEYRTDLFAEAFIAELIEALTLVLDQVSADAAQPLEALLQMVQQAHTRQQQQRARQLHTLSQGRLEHLRHRRRG